MEPGRCTQREETVDETSWGLGDDDDEDEGSVLRDSPGRADAPDAQESLEASTPSLDDFIWEAVENLPGGRGDEVHVSRFAFEDVAKGFIEGRCIVVGRWCDEV